jgi:hypothetical protein
MEKWDYTVVLEGTQGVGYPLAFKEHRHFNNMQQTLLSLLENGFSRFGSHRSAVGEVVDDDLFLNRIAVKKSANGRDYIQLFDIVDGGTAPGIYLGYSDIGRSVKDLEKEVGSSLSSFKDYEHSASLLQLAHYRPNGDVVTDHSLSSLITGLRQDTVGQDPWQLLTIEESTNQKQLSLNQHQYPQLKEAFIDLMGVDISLMDYKINGINEKKNYLYHAGIRNSDNDKEMVRLWATDQWPGPGAFFEFPAGIGAFTKQTGLDLTSLPDYHLQKRDLLHVGYYHHKQAIIKPRPEFLALRQVLNTPPDEKQLNKMRLSGGSTEELDAVKKRHGSAPKTMNQASTRTKNKK